MSKPTFTISRASLKDVPRIGEISTRAFDKDRNSQVKIMGQRPGAFAEGMAMGARSWIESQKAVLLKATDDRDGTIVGSVAFGYTGVPLDPSAGEGGDESQVEVNIAGGTKHETDDEQPIPGADKIRALEGMTSKNLHDFMDKRTIDSPKSVFLGGISVDPRYEGQGIGSQLLSWGTEQADRFGAVMWVHSSEAGWPLFRKHGFEEVEHLTFDLDEYAVGPPPKDGVFGDREKWGTYTFRYGMRQPVRA